MRKIKKWQLLTIFLVNAMTFNACSNNPTESSQAQLQTDVQQKTKNIQQQLTPIGDSPIQSDLDKAKKEGKAVFVVVSGSGITNTEQATTLAKKANALYENAVVLQMNRDDAANAQLVKNWRLTSAPLPLILVISQNGMPTGGYILEQATPENLAALIPSPKLETVYEAIGNSKYAIVVFTKEVFPDRAEVLKECNEAVSALGNEAVLVEVDMDDKKETGFMNQLRIDPKVTKASVTLVINKQGQVAGTSTTIPDSDKLVAAAKTPVKGGCGPGCGPAGCGQ